MSNEEKLAICSAIHPDDPHLEHCKCIIRAPQLHGEHICNCGFKWGSTTDELDEQFRLAMKSIDDMERRAAITSHEIFIR